MSSAQSGLQGWIISDGSAGNARQAMALAQALDLSPREVTLQLRHPWDWLAPRLTWRARQALRDSRGHPITSPWPDIAIGCGRQAALLTRCLRDWSKGRCFTVQILDPRVSPDLFDALVVPQHDGVHAPNVITTLGALHGVDAPWLAEARLRFASFAALPAPRVGVLIGGTHPAQALGDAYFDALQQTLAAWHQRHGGSFLVSTSRRTPARRRDQLRDAFSRWPGRFWSGPGDGVNPYPGILAWADRIVVSADSVNMVSEACATGRPVHAFAPKPILGKLGRFHQGLTEAGYLSPWSEASSTVPTPLRELPEVTRKVRLLWQAFQGDRAVGA